MAKPFGPLLELADRWRPIFADPDRDYFCLTELRTARRARSGARLDVAADDGSILHLTLTFVRPEVLRVQLFADTPPPRRTPMLMMDGTPESPTVVFHKDKRGITLDSAVLQARVDRHPFRLSVSGPDGHELLSQQHFERTMHLDRSMMGWAAYPMGFSRDAQGNLAYHETFCLQIDEHLYGLGEQYGPLDKRGQRIVSWNRDVSGLTGSTLTYLNVPFFLSSRGYAVFVNHTSPITYELGWPAVETAAFRVEDPYLDYFLIYGPRPKDILARYHQITGRAPLPPLWSFGVWMSRAMYMDRPTVEEVVSRLRDLGIPCDVVNLDPAWLKRRKRLASNGCDFVWNDEDFPDPVGFVQGLSERGVKVCLWENPYIWKSTPLYEEGKRRGYLVRTPDGGLAQSIDNPAAGLPDLTNPRAYRWWQAQHRPLLRMGVATFKTDYAEGVPEDALFANGRTGKEMHNAYPLLYNQASFETVAEERGEGVVWGRSGYAGSQRYPLNWVGDSPISFAGMAAALRAMLSLGVSGIPFSSHDIGGFWSPAGPAALTPPLYIRWAQFGLLSSHARFHGIGPREPWAYGEEAVAIVREFARLRYRLLPYLWALAHQASEMGVPVVRPMWLEFPDDPVAPSLDRQYMLGPSLLVAPVFNEEGRCRVYVPAGRWYDFWTNEPTAGLAYLDLEVPLERVPLFVREDSILPLAPAMDYVGQRPWEPIQLDVRVSSRAFTTCNDPTRAITAEAELVGRRLTLAVDSPQKGFEVRFLAPPRLRDIEATGAASRVEITAEGGIAIVRLQAGGPFSLTAFV
jgi:alpha-D-xyloside xylohydrolase